MLDVFGEIKTETKRGDDTAIWYLARNEKRKRPRGLLILSNGMNYHYHWKEIHRLGIETIYKEFEDFLEDTDDTQVEKVSEEYLKSKLQTACIKANEVIIDYGQHPQFSTGATKPVSLVTVVVICGTLVVVANVGNNRCYHLSENEFKQITIDHSFYVHYKRLVNEEELEPIDAEDELSLHHMVTKILGGTEDTEPDIFVQQISIGDKLLLCDSRLWTRLTDEELKHHLLNTNQPETTIQRLLHSAQIFDGAAVIVAELTADKNSSSSSSTPTGGQI